MRESKLDRCIQAKFYGEFYRRNGSKLRLRLGRNKQKNSLIFSAILLRICSLSVDYY